MTPQPLTTRLALRGIPSLATGKPELTRVGGE